MADATLVLRDIHQSAAPAWWPPAPGWWMLAAFALIAVVLWQLWRARKARQRRVVARLFDDALAGDGNLPMQVAAMSGLLRRAARRRDPRADTLQGDAWLAFLDAGDPSRPFSQGEGRLLLEGGFRREADPTQVAALQTLVRARFIRWMTQ
ncbi:DUF4381 domain-containing protein [Lysobacter terrae]